MVKKQTRIKKEHWTFLRKRATKEETSIEAQLENIIESEIKQNSEKGD